MNEERKLQSKIIHLAYCTLGDFFSRLGGSARYYNMPESDIPLFIGCELAKKIFPEFIQHEYLENEFLNAAKTVIPEVQLRLSNVTNNPYELVTLIQEFTSYVDAKYKYQHRSIRWEKFIDWINDQILLLETTKNKID